MPVCLSHGGMSTYASKSPSAEVLVGTVSGVVAIQRENSRAWGVARRSLEEFHISTLLVERSNGLIFAGAHKGSLYASGDGGRNWELRDRGLSHKDVYALGQGDGKLYVGTEPAHLFESSDLGARWEELPKLRSVPNVPQWTFPGPPHIAHVKNIALDPSDSKKIYVAVEVGALLKSEDGGLSWQELDGFDDAHRVVVHPAKPNWVYFSHGGPELWDLFKP